MKDKEHKELIPKDNDQDNSLNSYMAQGSARQTFSAQVPPSLLPTVLQRLGLAPEFSEFSEPEFAVDTLIEQLHSEQWEERLNAVRALGRLGTGVPVELLTNALHDEDGSVRAAALFALGNVGRHAPLHLLVAALNDSDWHVREMAVLSLGKQGKRVPQEVLQASLHDTDHMVREATTLALQWHTTITKLENTAVLDGQQWEQLLMQQKESQQNGHPVKTPSNEDWNNGISIEYSSDTKRPQRVLYEQQQSYAAQSSQPDREWQTYQPQEPSSGGQMFAPQEPSSGGQMFAQDEPSSEERVREERQHDPDPESSYEYNSPPVAHGEKLTSLPRQKRKSTVWWVLLVVMVAIVFFLLGGVVISRSAVTTEIAFPSSIGIDSKEPIPPMKSGFSIDKQLLNPQFTSQARQEIADGLNLSTDDITGKLQAGASLQEIASAQNVNPDQLHTIELNAITNLINSGVKAGNINENDGNQMLQHIQSNPETLNKLVQILFLSSPASGSIKN